MKSPDVEGSPNRDGSRLCAYNPALPFSTALPKLASRDPEELSTRLSFPDHRSRKFHRPGAFLLSEHRATRTGALYALIGSSILFS